MRALERRTPRFGSVVAAVGRVTFLEIVRDKVLYNVLLAAILLFGISALASRLSAIETARVIRDFGLTALNVSCLMIAVLVGAGLLGREFERRTIHVAFSHPISRLQFVVGKFAGLAAVLFLNWLLMSGAYLALLWGELGQLSLSFTFLSAIGLILLQTLVMGAASIFFSSFSTTSLSVMFSLGVYLIGTNSSEIRLLATKVQSAPARVLLNGIATFLPNFEHFNLGLKVTYDLPVASGFVLVSVGYGLLVSAILVCAAGFLVQAREV